MTIIFWPEDTPTGNSPGGKALSLRALRTSGLQIPPWFAVLPAAFDASVQEMVGPRPESGTDDKEMDDILASLRPSAAVVAEVESALIRLCPDGGAVAVRSSAVDEDGKEASFAGQLESFLGVRAADVPAMVAAVWRSGFSARVRAYCAQHGLGPATGAPAVLVQRMVCADVSGVVFGADPVSGNRDRLVVAAVPGLGLGLVNGESDADTWHLDAAGVVLTRQVALKSAAWRFIPDGLHHESLSSEAVAQPCLRDDQLAAIAAAAAAAGRQFGTPQDVEWAIEDGQLYVLQSRPITTLPNRTPDDQPFAVWDNSNIVESYSGVTTPLTFSFAQRAYEGVYRQFCRLLAVPAPRIAASDSVFRNMLGLHRGRIYYNLLNWYRVLAMLPGFTVNRRFMEQMMGVKEPMPDDIVATLERATVGARLKDAFDLARSAAALAIHCWRLPTTIRRFRARLNDALHPPPRPLDSLSAGALAATFIDLEQRLLNRWDAPLLNDFFTMIFYGVLRDVTARWSGHGARPLHNDLLCDGGGMLSAEPARRLAEMARLAATDDTLPGMLAHATRHAIDQAVDRHPPVRAARDAYLEKFGDRCFDELKLESPTLLDDPLPLYRAIGRLASAPVPAPVNAPASATIPAPRAAAEARMAQALTGHPLRRLLFRWILNQARSGVRERENLRLERTRLFGRVRLIFLALGQRWHELGVLDQPRDVFHLEVDDVLRFVSGATTTVRLRELAALRQAEFELHRQAPPLPNRFTTRGIPSQHLPPWESVSPDADAGGNERTGIGCCPGRVRGRVCVVTDPNHSTVRSGEILVAERTDPGWIMLFPGAAGLLVERGSLLSHSAIVARELRLPAIVSIPGLMGWLHDGDHVEFDGSSGVVRKVPCTESATEADRVPSIQSIMTVE